MMLGINNHSLATDIPPVFSNAEYQSRYYELIEEVRCLVCQNQSLADSNAGLAQDLRNIIIQKINEGKDNQEIIQFLTDRYGDFVLYRPPVKSSTLLLWSGPFLILIVAIIILIRTISLRKTTNEDHLSSAESGNRVSEILESDGDKQ